MAGEAESKHKERNDEREIGEKLKLPGLSKVRRKFHLGKTVVDPIVTENKPYELNAGSFWISHGSVGHVGVGRNVGVEA